MEKQWAMKPIPALNWSKQNAIRGLVTQIDDAAFFKNSLGEVTYRQHQKLKNHIKTGERDGR